MGFKDDKVERALLYSDIDNISDLTEALTPDVKGFWRHTLVSRAEANHIYCRNKYCHICDPANKHLFNSVSTEGSKNASFKNRKTAKVKPLKHGEKYTFADVHVFNNDKMIDLIRDAKEEVKEKLTSIYKFDGNVMGVKISREQSYLNNKSEVAKAKS